MNPTPSTPSHRPRPSDRREAALWPIMLRATGLGLRPERIIVAFIAALLVSGMVRIPIPWESSASLSTLWNRGTLRTDTPAWSMTRDSFLGLQASWLDHAAGFFAAHLWSALAPGVPIVAVLVVASAVIARSAALEFAFGSAAPVRAAARLVAERLPSLAAAFGIPALLAALAGLLMAACGALLLAFPGVVLLGSLLYGMAVLASVLFVVLLAAFALGSPMLAPAVVCEGTGTGEHGRGDAIDALQRVLAYVLNAPLRLALFAVVGLVQIALVSWIGTLIAAAAGIVARHACTLWLSQDRAAALTMGGEGTTGFASGIMAFWEWLPFVLAAACTLSVFASASSLLYLLLRRTCDGQHESEVWTPLPVTSATSEPSPSETHGERDDDE